MDPLLVKIFATALTFSQVATAPDAVKTQFDPAQDAPHYAHNFMQTYPTAAEARRGEATAVELGTFPLTRHPECAF
jgi:hypothetical protein